MTEKRVNAMTGTSTQNLLREKILLHGFTSASALKDEIRKRIDEKAMLEWNLCRMNTRGSFIVLVYEHKN